MKIHKLFYLLLGFILVSCSNPFEEEAPPDFFTQTPHVLPKHLKVDDLYGRFMVPNAFTPGKETCNEFKVNFEYSYLDRPERSSLDYFKIFDSKKKLVRNLDELKWDGTNENGTYVFGEFSFEASLTLPTGQQVKGIGYILSIGDCITSNYDLKYMIFSDQLHPRLGIILPTQAEVAFCEE